MNKAKYSDKINIEDQTKVNSFILDISKYLCKLLYN